MTSRKPLAIVFGGSRGIGAATVKALAANGFDVAFTYASQSETAHKLVADTESAGQTVRAYWVDICDRAAVNLIFENCISLFGVKPKVVVANAGINVPAAPMAEFDDAAFRRLVEVNLVGAFNVLKGAAQNVDDHGSIIALTTSLVRHVVAGVGPYSATKAAVECLVRSMAKELAPRGVRVNAVAPGPVDTELFNSGKTPEAKQRSAAMSPLNRIAETDEIAQVVAFLASEKASWMDGQIVQPNGALV